MDLPILFCEEHVCILETLARSLQLNSMVEKNGKIVRFSNVWLALKHRKFFELIETEELLFLLEKFKNLKLGKASNYAEERALQELDEVYSGDMWQWALDAFEGRADESLCPAILSLLSREWP